MSVTKENEVEVRRKILVSGNQAKEILLALKNRISTGTLKKMAKEIRRETREIEEAIQFCISLLSYGVRERNPILENQVRGILINMRNKRQDMRDGISPETFQKIAKETRRSIKEIQDTIHKCVTLLS